jgi:type II secretory pathway component PulK
MKSRPGFAMLAALWLVVAIAAVVLQFSLEARERRVLGLDASDRGMGRAAAEGALAQMQARLEEASRQTLGRGGNLAARLRGSDPWLGVDSIYSGTYQVDSMPVEVRIGDLGAVLNINSLSETEITNFFSRLTRNFPLSEELAQSIMDWRDADSLARPRGGERDQYLKEELLVLPANAPFREVEELLLVRAMTPEIYAMAAPYLTTRGASTINVNTAPEPVLASVAGMTDALVAGILAARSGGRRIDNLSQVLGNTGGGRGGGGQQNAVLQRLQSRFSTSTTQVELSITAYPTPSARPTRLLAVLQRTDNGNTTVLWKQW